MLPDHRLGFNAAADLAAGSALCWYLEYLSAVDARTRK